MNIKVKDFFNSEAEKPLVNFVKDLNPGEYTAKVTKCAYGTTANGENKVEWNLLLLDGNEKGSYVGIHCKFSITEDTDENKKNIRKMQNYFKSLQLPCNSDKIAESMAYIVGKTINMKVVAGSTGGTFYNFKEIIENPTSPLPADFKIF